MAAGLNRVGPTARDVELSAEVIRWAQQCPDLSRFEREPRQSRADRFDERLSPRPASIWQSIACKAARYHARRARA
jgi:hypothetical protein